MLCENCKQNQATVHTVTIINGKRNEQYMCAECAKGIQQSLPFFIDILAGFQAAPQVGAGAACGCGSDLCQFPKSGLLGCAECYTTHREALLPVIRRAQGGRIRHVGRVPQGFVREEPEGAVAANDVLTPQQECARLREELQTAIKEERYERAAELRDRLRMVEGGQTE